MNLEGGYPREWLEEPDGGVIRHSGSTAVNKSNVPCAISRILVGGETGWLRHPPLHFLAPYFDCTCALDVCTVSVQSSDKSCRCEGQKNVWHCWSKSPYYTLSRPCHLVFEDGGTYLISYACTSSSLVRRRPPTPSPCHR